MGSGNLDDLEFELSVGLDESLKNLREVNDSINGAKGLTADLSTQFDKLNTATLQLATSGMLPVKNSELLMAGLGSIGRSVEAITGQFDRMATRLDTAVAASSADIGEHWLYINKGVTNGTAEMRRFAEQAKAAAAATQTIVVDTVSNKMQAPQKQAPSFDLVKIASAALAVKAINGVSNAMTTAKMAIADIGKTTTVTISSLDRFRIGLAAPAVNPALNALPGLIQNITNKVAGAIEGVRGFGDATIAGLPNTLTSIASGLGRVMGSGDSLQATVSKLTAEFDIKRAALDRVAKIYPTTGTAVDLLKQAMDFIAPAAAKVAQEVDKANDSVRAATIGARNLAYIATGSFKQTGTSADLYARGAYHALLPMRLLAFEAKFAQGSLTLMRRGWVALTSPIHSVSMAIQRSRGEFRELRANLPALTGGLQLGTRAFRAFSHASYFSATALKTLRTAATPVTMIGSAIWRLVRPAQAAKTGLDGVATGGHKAGLVLRAVTGAASTTAGALSKVGSAGAKMASGKATGFLSALPSMATMGAAALGGLGIAAAMMGSKLAMATEKNQAVFGTMVHSMEQGKAIVSSIQGTKAAGLFDNQELLDSGRLLFKGGVAAVDLAGKTDQLAKIAIGTSSELGDLARIYQQGANSGSFGQDKVNQLAERGIAIYEGLTHATGKSGGELKKMISDGKIGIAEMDSALAYLTTGTGYYANALVDLGSTTSGMLSQIKNNLMQALGTIMGAGNEARKPFMQMLVGWSESIKTNVSAVLPVVNQFLSAIQGIFSSLYSVATTTFTGIFGASTSTFSSILSGAMEWVTKFRWFFESIVPITQFVGLSMVGVFVTSFNDIAYWLTDKMPAYMSWFGDNWMNVFTDIGNATATVFVNLAKNIGNAMTAIWDFIKSGGTADLELAWTPLLDGFESTVAALPDIPDRAMTELEQAISQQTQEIGTKLANDFDALNMEAQAALTVAAPVMPEIDPTLQAGGVGGGEDGMTTTAGAGKQRSSFAVSGLEKGSEAALNAIFSAQKDKTPQQALAESRKQTTLLTKIANRPEPHVLGAAG